MFYTYLSVLYSKTRNLLEVLKMNSVNIVYRYINCYINSEELLAFLKEMNKSSFSKEEIAEINELLEKVETIIKNVPIEIDEVERKKNFFY